MKDGRELTNSSRINIMHSSNGASSLYIPRTAMEDTGVYQITAGNDFGIAMFHADVDVERMLN